MCNVYNSVDLLHAGENGIISVQRRRWRRRRLHSTACRRPARANTHTEQRGRWSEEPGKTREEQPAALPAGYCRHASVYRRSSTGDI